MIRKRKEKKMILDVNASFFNKFKFIFIIIIYFINNIILIINIMINLPNKVEL